MTKHDAFLTNKEASELYRCSVKTIERMIDRKELTTYRPHGKILLKRSELMKKLEGSVE